MLRLVVAVLVGFGVLAAGVALVGDSSSLALLGVGLVAMLVTAALAPHVFVYGDWPPAKSDRADHS
jgi:hypothetical protein